MPAASVDIVVSIRALRYVFEPDELLERLAGWLRPGGWLVASIEHPIRTAGSEQQTDNLYVVDRYTQEGPRHTSWYIDGVIKYHRRLSTIIDSVIAARLATRQVKEPTPSATSIGNRPELQNHCRRPALLRLSATKP